MTKQKRLIDQIREKTKNLRSTSEITVSDNWFTRMPKTGPGILVATLAAAQKIEELKKQTEQSIHVPMSAIYPNPWARKTTPEPEAIAELAEGIQKGELLEPIIVRINPDDASRFQIIEGEILWRAHQLLNVEEIKVLVGEFRNAEMALWARPKLPYFP